MGTWSHFELARASSSCRRALVIIDDALAPLLDRSGRDVAAFELFEHRCRGDTNVRHHRHVHAIATTNLGSIETGMDNARRLRDYRSRRNHSEREHRPTGAPIEVEAFRIARVVAEHASTMRMRGGNTVRAVSHVKLFENRSSDELCNFQQLIGTTKTADFPSRNDGKSAASNASAARTTSSRSGATRASSTPQSTVVPTWCDRSVPGDAIRSPTCT